MKPFTLLIPTDGSPFSRQVLTHVCRLLDSQQYNVILLRVADPPTGLIGSPARPIPYGHGTLSAYISHVDAELAQHPIYAHQVRDSLQAELEAELRADVSLLQEHGYSVTVMVRFGDPVEEIIDVAEQQAVDMVAMATHGRTGLQQLLMGSVAAQVLRALTIPVFVIRPTEQAVERMDTETLATTP